MFARWRNLAAAAGAIWFPFTFAQASPHLDDLRYDLPCTRPAACARYHDAAEMNAWQKYDRESWYQQYYNDSSNDPTAISDWPGKTENPPSYESNFTTGNGINFFGRSAQQFSEPENPQSDEPGAVLEPRIEDVVPAIDSDGRCSDPTCPCHDTIDLDSDDLPIKPDLSSFDESFCPAGQYNFERGCLDVYSPYSFEDELRDEPAPSTTRAVLIPNLKNLDEELSEDLDQFILEESLGMDAPSESATTTRLSGTIEPLFEECDEEAMEGYFYECGETTTESTTIQNEDEPISNGDYGDGEAEESQKTTEDAETDSTDDQGPRFHMFYPGCDWNRYNPTESRQRAGNNTEQVD